jgi:large subunit ribosomal protein L29
VPSAAELAELDDDELAGRLRDYRRELLNMRFQIATSQLDNTARLSTVRKDIARVMTLIREREIALAEGRELIPEVAHPRPVFTPEEEEPEEIEPEVLDEAEPDEAELEEPEDVDVAEDATTTVEPEEEEEEAEGDLQGDPDFEDEADLEDDEELEDEEGEDEGSEEPKEVDR